MSLSEKRIALTASGPARRLVRPEGFKMASISVGFTGEVIRLLVAEELAAGLVARIEQPGWASFPKTHTDREYSSILVVSRSSGSREIGLSGLTATFAKIELLPDGEILVVASRCLRHPDGSFELNAKVYDPTGRPKREFLLGDGINHVQADAKGNVWVAYFDEGVYGNFGWQHDGGPFGAAGLSCFNCDGHKMWDFHPPEGFDHISDCYGLNVSSTGAWAYYYTDFPIALIDSEWRVRCWQTGLAGGKTFAVDGGRVLLYVGYGDQRTACQLLELHNHDAKLIAKVSLVLPSEVDLSQATVIGRGKELHVFSGDDWFVFSIDAL